MICFCGLFAKEALEMDAVELTRELIKIESTDPGSWETEIGEYICDYLKESGADTETYEVEPGRKL